VKLKATSLTSGGLRLLDTWTPLLMVVTRGSDDTGLILSYWTGVGLQDTALGDVILVSLAIPGLGSGGQLGCDSLD